MKRKEFLKMTAGLAGAAALAWGAERKEGLPSAAAEGGSRDPRVDVDLERIGWNLDRVRDRAGVPVMAVVKANAYGHGLVDVSKYLERRGAQAFMVGKLDEAVRLRSSGVRAPIVNFGPFSPADAGAVVDHDITQSASTDDVFALDEAASRSPRPASVDVHIDTGMNRAGVAAERAIPFLEKLATLRRVRIRGISTTLTEDPEFDAVQLRRFLDICAKARQKGIEHGPRHAASSAGLLAGPEFRLDMVRPGIMLYGYYPNARTRKEDALGLKPALRLAARVTFIGDVAAGESISYVRAIKAERPMRVAAVGIGYSDGYPPALGGTGVVRIRGENFPVLPAVTSNHIMVDLRNNRGVEIGDEAVLLDSDRSSGAAADSLAELGGLSDYKLLIGINPLIPRVYKGSAVS